MSIGRFDEAGKQRMRTQRLRSKLGMKLNSKIPRMRRQFGDLDEFSIRRTARNAQAVFGERAFVETVELVTVAMTLLRLIGSVHPLREGALRRLAAVPTT